MKTLFGKDQWKLQICVLIKSILCSNVTKSFIQIKLHCSGFKWLWFIQHTNLVNLSSASILFWLRQVQNSKIYEMFTKKSYKIYLKIIGNFEKENFDSIWYTCMNSIFFKPKWLKMFSQIFSQNFTKKVSSILSLSPRSEATKPSFHLSIFFKLNFR